MSPTQTYVHDHVHDGHDRHGMRLSQSIVVITGQNAQMRPAKASWSERPEIRLL